MSFHLSWIAVKGLDKPALLETLGLAEVEADRLRPDWALAELGDWLVVLAEDFSDPSPKLMAMASTGGVALACSIDERTVYSVACGYADGQAVWSVDHDGGQKGVYHLNIAGTPPPEFTAARDRLKAQQDAEGGEDAGVDYVFDVPACTIEALCGYKFDPQEEGGPVFRPLEKIKPKGGLLGKLFGRK